ncbi:uncharacterized protein LOC141811219 [Halichoeres trimaculatus]|uniref:uncharacterized protein LOC141811219 n=1 Tax=Halichoeres trimaculatus TaxID=147232 RepID=UPI003D9F0A95
MEVGGGVVLGLSVDMKLSKAELLREIVCEKLTTAAREIFAVVERTVSGYEEEAAALRREVERQKEQLEAVLQPRVTLRRIDWEDSATWAGSEDDEVEDVEDKEPEKKEGGAIKLQVCLLQDAHADMLTRNVFKSSVQEVMCPPDLKEAEFLDLLRSTFPQLSAEFEAFTVDVTQKLTPLNLETVTPENMEAAIKSRGNGPSALYVRVKVEESQSSPEQSPSSETNHQTKDDATNDHEGARASFYSVCVERAESRQHQTEPKEEVKHGGISEDFTAPDSAHCAADSDDGDDAEDETDDGDEEWKPDENDEKIESLKPNDIPPKTKKKKKIKNSVVKRKSKVCQALSGSRNMLIKHSWSHVEDPEELRSHLNSHKKTYRCDVCGKNFIYREMKHAAAHAGEKPNRCDDCCKVFHTPGELTVHHRRSRNKRKAVCGVCGKRLSSSDSLKRHLSVHSEERPHECSVCKQTFKHVSHLQRHMKIHLGVKAFVCSVCGRAFLGMKGLTFHMRMHNEERLYECSVCKLAFKFRSALTRHTKIHAGVKAFVCGVCGKAVLRKEQLTLHMRQHNGEKPYKCPICDKGFVRNQCLKTHMEKPCGQLKENIFSDNLKVHAHIHTGERPYRCDVCDKTYASRARLRIHRWEHTEEKPHICDVCNQSFLFKLQLRVHSRSHTEGSLLCDVCGKGLSSEGALRKHQISHTGERPYECTVCGRAFQLSRGLRNHMKLHSVVKPFVCPVCGKACSRTDYLRVHMRKHNGEKPYKCTVCVDVNMFYWLSRNSGGSETLDGLGDMSKAEILRGIVTEKLSTAAQEILAVVERTVAGYEEEVAGLKQEIDRQKNQLEAVLQPRVALEKRDHEVVVLSEEDEEHLAQQSGLGHTGSLAMWYGDNEDEDEDEEQPISAHLTSASIRQRQEDLKDPDFEVTQRVRSGRRRPGRPRLIDSQSHLDLKIRILGDSYMNVHSNNVFPKSIQDLRCPLGLQEADFLDLLRSTFPQLADQTSLEFFTSDRSKRLHPLSVARLTPEEIYRSVRLSGTGKSTVYIRLKTAGGPQSSSEDFDLLQRPDLSLRQPAGVRPERRKRGRPRLGEGPTHHRLRVCLLEDSQTEVLSKRDLLNSPVQDLNCPRGLQEEDFLGLLRSSFPQLSDGKSFSVFKSDRSRRLRRLHVKTLTPEEIYRSMRSTGVEKSLLYLRLKTGEEEEEDVVSESPSPAAQIDSSSLLLSSSPQPGDGGTSAQPQGAEERQTDASEDGELRNRNEDRKPNNDDGLSNPRRRQSDQGRLMVSRDPCKVCGVWYRIQRSLVKHAWSHVDEVASVCGVCGQQFESVEELKEHLRTYQKTHDCSYCAKSFLSVTGLQRHTTLHTGERPFKCEVCGKAFAHTHGLRLHRWVHATDKPHKCDVCQKAFGLKATLRAHRKTHSGRDSCQCNVCGKSLRDLRSLARHKMTHSGERRYGCAVCGKRFKLAYTLKCHEKTHTSRERLFLCHICCKSFFSNCGLTAHMRTHNDVRPFPCAICGKGFVSNAELKVHMRVHTGEAPYGCSQCGRHFKRKTHLNTHVRSHLGVKLFVCSVCGKACSRQEHLTVHMRTHNGERPYQCSMCEKAFTQGHCLKTHMKTHHGQDAALLNAPST